MLLLSFILFSSSSLGVDVSEIVTMDSFQCLKKSGYFDIVIIRGWRSNGKFDQNSVQTCANAHQAGASIVDLYFYPCVSCGDPAGQVQTFWQHVQSNKMNIHQVWFDIEGTWFSNISANQQFLENITNQAMNLEIDYGLYVNSHNWNTFFGESYVFKYADLFPLWYPHYDNQPSFSDFVSFGGWKKPKMKQYAENLKICNATVDLNFLP